jgi:hypothetical protein
VNWLDKSLIVIDATNVGLGTEQDVTTMLCVIHFPLKKYCHSWMER